MKIFALFILRKGMDDSPELIEAWDEWSVDNWHEGWEEAQAKALESVGTDLDCSAVVEIDIAELAVMRALRPTHVVHGAVAAVLPKEG